MESGRAEPYRASLSTPAADTLVAEWMSLYGTAVFRLAYAFLGDRQQAEDVFQEVFLKAYQHNRRLTDANRVRPWLLQVTANRCRDLRRTAWWRRVLRLQTDAPEAPVTEPGPAEAAESGATRDAVARAVWQLPAGFRETVVLHYYEGLSAPDIAGLLGISEGTVHSRLHRARQHLKALLQQWEVEP